MDYARWRDWSGQDVAAYVSAFAELPQYSKAIAQNISGPALERLLVGGTVGKGLARAGICDLGHQKKIGAVFAKLATEEPEALSEEFAQLRTIDTRPIVYPPVPKADLTRYVMSGSLVCKSSATMPKPAPTELRLRELAADPGGQHRSADRALQPLWDDVPPDAPQPKEPKPRTPSPSEEKPDGEQEEDEEEEVHLLPEQKLRAKLATTTGEYQTMCFRHPDLAFGPGARGAQALKEQAAATRIQAMHRGKKSRQEVQQLRDIKEAQEQEVAAAKIQSRMRGQQARRDVAAMKAAKDRRASDVRRAAQEREEAVAATRLQAAQRGRLARRDVEAKRNQRAVAEGMQLEGTDEEQAAALRIQSMHRGKAARQEVEQKRREHIEEENAATKIQAKYRGMSTRKSMHGVDVSPSPVRRVSAQAEDIVSEQMLQGAACEEKSKQECMSALVGALSEDDKAKDECMQALVGAMTASEDLPQGTDEENAAAAKIQAVHRGKKARRSLDDKRAEAEDGEEKSKQECMSALVGALSEDDKAKDDCMQAMVGAMTASEDLPRGSDEENAAAAKIQAVHRGKKARRSVDDKRALAAGLTQEDDAAKAEISAALEAALVGPEESARAEVHTALCAALAEEDLPQGTDDENAAAAKIQAVHRGKKARRSVEEKRAAAAGPAQEAEEALPEGTDEEHAAASRIQAVQRGKQARKEVDQKRLSETTADA